MKNTSGRFGVAIDIELGGGRHVAGPAERSADHDQVADHVRQVGLLLQGGGDVRERPRGDDRHIAGRRPHFVADHLHRRMLMVPLGHGEMGAAHAVGAEQVPAIGPQHLVVRGSAQSRPAGRIELLDDRLHVRRRLLGRHRAAGGRDGDHFQRRIAERHAQGHGVVDAGIYVEDYFSGHPSRRLLRPP